MFPLTLFQLLLKLLYFLYPFCRLSYIVNHFNVCLAYLLVSRYDSFLINVYLLAAGTMPYT